MGLGEGQSDITAFFSPISPHEDVSMSEMEGSVGGGGREGEKEEGRAQKEPRERTGGRMKWKQSKCVPSPQHGSPGLRPGLRESVWAIKSPEVLGGVSACKDVKE